MFRKSKAESNANVVSPADSRDAGFNYDDQELRRLGRKPVLKRAFNFLAALALSSTLMVTWEGVVFTFAVNLLNGGLAGSVWGYVVVWIGTTATYATVAELASMAPTSAGQYHWVAILAPKRIRVFSSYIVGWTTMIGWQAVVASGCYIWANVIQGLIILNDDTHVPQPWQTMLLYWSCILAALLFNTTLFRYLPGVETFLLFLHLALFLAVLVPLVTLGPKNNATDVFTAFENGGMWPTQGLSVMVGLTGAAYSFLGSDGIVHMSEESANPAKNAPRAMFYGVLLNGFLGFGMLIALLFSIGDFDTVLNSPTGQPFVEVLGQAFQNSRGTQTACAFLALMDLAAVISFVATGSRMLWAFARDQGIPGWKRIKWIEPRSKLPVWGLVITTTVAILLSLIILGSSVAFNDVVSLTIAGLYSSYLVGNTALLWRRITGQIHPYEPSRGVLTNTIGAEKLTWGPWRVPEPFGTVVNAFGCAYMVVMLFFSFWPTVNNPDAAGMNYSSLVFGAVIIFAVIYYGVHGRRDYSGPIIEVIPEDTVGGEK